MLHLSNKRKKKKKKRNINNDLAVLPSYDNFVFYQNEKDLGKVKLE